jgi:phage terminase small subunit
MRLRKKTAPPSKPALPKQKVRAVRVAAEPDAPLQATSDATGGGARDGDGLTFKQAAFVQNFLLTLNATEAAKLSGYSAKTARTIGANLLTNVNVTAALNRERERLADRYEVNIDRVVRELARIAFSDMRDFMKPGPGGSPVLDFSALTPDQSAVLQEVTVEEFKDGRSDQRQVRRTKFRKESKIAALELLGKYLGMFKEQVHHDHNHQHTVLGTILREIDEESRAAKAKATALLN